MSTREDEIQSISFIPEARDQYEELLEHIRKYGPSDELLRAVELGLLATVVPEQVPTWEKPAHPYENLTIETVLSILTLRDRQLSFLRKMWVRDAKEALDGDLRSLRNRVEMYEAPPVEITNGSET